MLLSESINDSVIETVKLLGGSKVVGCKLWPDKTPEQAQRALLDCLNPDRPARLTPEQLLYIMRLAREVGGHGIMAYIAGELGYAEPVPIEPEDERAKLQREFIVATGQLSKLAAQIERLGQPQTVRAA